MSPNKNSDELQKAMKLLEEHGYRVTKPVVWVQKNVDLDKDLWDRVNKVREGENMMVRECVAEALEIWLEHKGKGSRKNGA